MLAPLDQSYAALHAGAACRHTLLLRNPAVQQYRSGNCVPVSEMTTIEFWPIEPGSSIQKIGRGRATSHLEEA
jgi:hypothetical protein